MQSKNIGGNLLRELRDLFPDSQAVRDVEFRTDIKINKELSQKYAHRTRGSIRTSQGLYLSNADYEQRRKRVLSAKLP
jgi:hypothetical protein